MAKRKQVPDGQLSLDDALVRFTDPVPGETASEAPVAPFDRAREISKSLDALGVSWEERIQAIGGCFVLEALRPVWNEGGGSADAAHALLRTRDPELADAIEALAPMLYGRHRAGSDALAAIDEVERLIRSGR
jgi:hypothetical protein